MPSIEHENHDVEMRPCSSSKARATSEIQYKIKQKLIDGGSVLNAVEEVIKIEDYDVVTSKGKRAFYQHAHQFASRNNLLKPQIPQLKRDKEFFELFDEVRECIRDPFNDTIKFAIRPVPEISSLYITDLHIDSNFIILLTKEGLEIMSQCQVLFIDQNDEVTPEGCCRSLTIGGLFFGIICLYIGDVLVRNKEKNTNTEVALRLKKLFENEGFVSRFEGIGGDYELGLPNAFAYVFGCPHFGCDAHFGRNVRKHGPKFVNSEHLQWEKQLRTLPCLPAPEIIPKFEELKKEGFGILWNFGKTNAWDDVLEQLIKVDKVYLNGSHCTVETLSYFDRFQTRSNQGVERLNKTKNRHIRKAFGRRRRKNEKFSLEAYLEMFKNMERLAYIRAGEIRKGVNVPVKSAAYYQSLILRSKYDQGLISQKTYFDGMMRLSGKNPKPFPF